MPFATASYSGTLDSSVISGDATNPFGGLTFTYRLTNSAVSTGEIDRLSVNDYAGFLVDASYQAPTAGLPPALMSRSGLGDVVGFTYVGSHRFWRANPRQQQCIDGRANECDVVRPTLVSVLNGVGTMVSSLGPAVPEPCSVVLAGFGIAAVACLRLRGRRAVLELAGHGLRRPAVRAAAGWQLVTRDSGVRAAHQHGSRPKRQAARGRS